MTTKWLGCHGNPLWESPHVANQQKNERNNLLFLASNALNVRPLYWVHKNCFCMERSPMAEKRFGHSVKDNLGQQPGEIHDNSRIE